MGLLFRRCNIEDIDILRDFSCRTYFDTFKHSCTSSDMEIYLQEAFKKEKLLEELANPDSMFFFLYSDEELAGYLKLNEASAQSDTYNEDSLEIERIFVSRKFQGTGVGNYLMKQAIHVANLRKKQYIWLGVWEKNEKALNFYRKNGFYKIGTHLFVMGDDAQTDYIMRRDL